MADPKDILPSRAREQVFVALKTALEIGRLRPTAPLARLENIWALAVLLVARAYGWMKPNEAGYQVAVQALGPLGAGKGGSFWDAIVAVAETRDRASFEQALGGLTAQLSYLGVDFLAAAATESRLQMFREAAARIAPQPERLPQLETLFPGPGQGLGPLEPPGPKIPAAIEPGHPLQPAKTSTGRKLLVYGAPALGGLTLLFGVYRFMKMRKGEAHG